MDKLGGSYDSWKTYGGESEPDEPSPCEECSRPADPESPPLRGKVLCHACAAYLSFTVLESETEGRIAKLDAVARLRAFADWHEQSLQPKPVSKPGDRAVQEIRAEGERLMRLAATPETITHVCTKCGSARSLPKLPPLQGYGAWCGDCAARWNTEVREFERSDPQSQTERALMAAFDEREDRNG